MDYEKELKQLAQERKALKDLVNDIQGKLDILNENEDFLAYDEMEGKVTLLRKKISDHSTKIKDNAFLDANDFDDPNPPEVEGLSFIKKMDLTYEEGAAIDYCMEILPSALLLNVKLFEKYAIFMEDIQPLWLIDCHPVDKPTLKSDLSFLLEEDDEEEIPPNDDMKKGFPA